MSPWWTRLVDWVYRFIAWLTEYPEPFDPNGFRQRIVLFGMLICFVGICSAWTILTAKDKKGRYGRS